MNFGNPHILKRPSLFAMFCLSYLPLLFLLSAKVILANKDSLVFGGFTFTAIELLITKFGFVLILLMLGIYALVGTQLTLNTIKRNTGNAFPAKLVTIKPKNDEALSYLATYVLPLLVQGEIGLFEYITFGTLFAIYYKLYSTSSLILINPILNLKYGLYEVEYQASGTAVTKTALVISEHRWINEGEDIKLLKVSHRLYFAF